MDASLRRTFLFAAVCALGACARARQDLRGIELPAVAGGAPVELAACPTPKCLTVYVAPWCGICRASTGLISALRERLSGRGVSTRIVVGRDSERSVREYATEFGPDALLDPSGQVPLDGGVPQFIVTKPGGEVVRRVAGVPGLFKPPFPPQLLDRIAEALGVAAGPA